MNSFTITPMVTEEEMDEKGCIHWQTWHETYKDLMSENYLKNVTQEKCVEMAHRWPQNTLLLKVDDKIVGFSCYGENSDGDGEIIAIYLLSEYQKKKLGYELMNATFDKIADKTKVRLWVLKGNEKAIKFYERYGFRFDGTEKQSSVGTELRMEYRR